MTPPAWVCKKIAEIDPFCRVAFCYGDMDLRTGRKQAPYFALVKLLHEKDFEKELYRPPEWDRRGPIYSATADLKPDWEVNRVPCCIAQLSDDSLTNGTCLELIKDWVLDVRDKQYWHMKKLAKEWDESCRRMAEEATDVAKSHAQHALKVGEQGSTPIIPTKFIPKDEIAFMHGDYNKDLDNPHTRELQMHVQQWKALGWTTPEERGLTAPPEDMKDAK